MSETTTREKIKVMEAFEAGKKIQYRDAATDRPWRDWNAPAPMWNWAHLNYRIKPKPREWWVSLYRPRGRSLVPGYFYDNYDEATKDAEKQTSLSPLPHETIKIREVLIDGNE